MSKKIVTGDGPALVSSLDLLKGATIEALCVMRAEIPRQVDQYLLLRLKKGKRILRVILVAAEVQTPCPDDRAMLNDVLDGMAFFTLEEIRKRHKGKSLLKRNGPFRMVERRTIENTQTKPKAIEQNGSDDHGGVGAGIGQPESDA